MKKNLLFLLLGVLSATANSENYINVDALAAKLNDHPKIAQILARQSYFSEMADAELGLPQPSLILGLDNIPVNDPAFDRFLPTSKVIGIRQQIPNPDLRQARADTHRLRAQQQSLQASFQQQRLSALLSKQLIRAAQIENIRAPLARKNRLFDVMQKDLDGQLAAGMPVYSELETLDIKRNTLLQRINELDSEQQRIQADMQSLLGEVLSGSIAKQQLKDWSPDNADQLYPVLIAKQQIDIADQGISSAAAEEKPNYSVQALYKQRESGANFAGDDWVSIQASVSLPLWSTRRLNANKRAAMADKRSAEYAFDDIRRESVAQMQKLKADYQMYRQNMALLKARVKPLKQSIRSLQRRYAAGEINQQAILNTELALLDLEIEQINQYAMAEQTAAEFNSYIVNAALTNDVAGGKNEQ